jgi:hypothetical protein
MTAGTHLAGAGTRTIAGSMYTPRRASAASAGAAEVRCVVHPWCERCLPSGKPQERWGESSR